MEGQQMEEGFEGVEIDDGQNGEEGGEHEQMQN